MVLIDEEKTKFMFINVDAEVFKTIHTVSKKYLDCSEDCKYTFNTAYSLHKAIAFGEHTMEILHLGTSLQKWYILRLDCKIPFQVTKRG